MLDIGGGADSAREQALWWLRFIRGYPQHAGVLHRDCESRLAGARLPGYLAWSVGIARPPRIRGHSELYNDLADGALDVLWSILHSVRGLVLKGRQGCATDPADTGGSCWGVGICDVSDAVPRIQ